MTAFIAGFLTCLALVVLIAAVLWRLGMRLDRTDPKLMALPDDEATRPPDEKRGPPHREHGR